jgi:hypothetical protein
VTKTQSTMPSNRWGLTVASVYTIGYLYAVLPPAILDPLLTSHVRFGARHYDGLGRVIPCAIAVALGAFLFARRHYNPLWVGMPLLAAAAYTNIAIMPKELPHIHLVFVCTVWLSACSTWIWIRGAGDHACASAAASAESPIEYVKEQCTFFRTMAFGLVGAFLALLVAGLLALHGTIASTVTDKREAFLLFILNNVTISAYALLLLFCPAHEAVRAWKRIAKYLIPRSHEPERSAAQQKKVPGESMKH